MYLTRRWACLAGTIAEGFPAATRAVLGELFRFEPRGEVAVKRSGPMETFFLLGPA